MSTVRDINAILGSNHQHAKNNLGSFSDEQYKFEPPIFFEESAVIPKVSLLEESRKDILSSLSRSLAKSVQFPPNTAFFHGLACLASAMNKSFYYSYYGSESPVNLYAVSSQPPSTGKSAINKTFVEPIRMAYENLNAEQGLKRSDIEVEIAKLQNQLKEMKEPEGQKDIKRDLLEWEDKLAKTPIYNYSVSNATPEALETVAFSQNGIWNLISDEAGSVNIVLGGVYGEASKKSNADLFLQSWDGEWFSSARVTRKKSSGYVRGCMAVIAQDETIETLLQEGMRGNGISERVLIMREENLLGLRDHFKFEQVDPQAKRDYAKLVNDIVMAEKTVLQFSDQAMVFIRSRKQELETDLADGGRYSSNLMRGAIGKMDKQVMKIASILHCVENFRDGNCPITISETTVKWAYSLYRELAKMYESAAQSKGYAGELAEVEICLGYLQRMKEKGKLQINLRQLRDAIKNNKVFKGKKGLGDYLKQNTIPMMCKLNYCNYIDETKIYINPMV